MATTNLSKVPIGTVLEGKFRITREIGRGGMAAVYEAENIDIGKRVAVKILAAELITSRVVRERFIREARASASIRSPYICDVYDSGMYEDRPFLVMELLEGESLYDMMTRVRQIDAQTTLRIATHSARGLAKAHESNVVHRDLKPENIFLTKDEEGNLLAKVLDFGLAKFYEPTTPDAASVRLTREGALFGTPAYMSPEQAKGQGEVDHRADLWALGCIVYECLTGQTVWNVEQGVAMILAQIASAPLPNPLTLRPDLPRSFERWFERALNRDPDKRYQTSKEFAESLAEAFAGKDEARADSGTTPAFLTADTVVDNRLPHGLDDADRASTPTPGERDPMVLSTETPPAKSSSLRAVSVLMVLSALALGGYATWLYVLHPPGKPELRPPPSAARLVPSSRPKPPPKAEPVMTDTESEPYAQKIAEGQQLLQKEPALAIEAFRAALKDGGMPPARSLLSHAQIALEEKGKCRLTGIARPRPFQIDTAVSAPSITITSKGPVIGWVDNHLDPRRRQVFTVLLDSAMRRISLPIDVTPEAQNVREFQIVPVGERLALLYWEDSGKEQGVFARLLDAEGKIDTSLRKLSSGRKGDYYPSLATTPNGDFWAVWEEEFENSASDVVARHLGPDLEPKTAAVRLTAFGAPPGSGRQPRMPAATIGRGQLFVALAKDLGSQRVQVMLQTIALDDPALTTGIVRKVAKGAAVKKGDEVIGSVKSVSSASSRNPHPRLTCPDVGCFVVWDDEKAGGLMTFVDHERGPLWHREFGSKGAAPGIGRDEKSLAIGWFETARLKFAPLVRDGIGTPSVVSRVSGIQPPPEIAKGSKAGEWYVAFRDYESAHLEIFVLRAECP
jgi:serine/threonine protein kinase